MYKYKSLQADQQMREHLPFLKNLLNFVIKYLKQNVDDNEAWSVYNSRYKDWSMSRDQKCNDTITPMEKCPFYCKNLITISPL